MNYKMVAKVGQCFQCGMKRILRGTELCKRCNIMPQAVV